jgi:uncharacterized protein
MDPSARTAILDSLAGIAYERCVLFGSRSRGDFTPSSDYDLLLVVREPPAQPERVRLAATVRKRLAQRWIDADVIVRSSSEVEYYKNKTGSIVQNALEEGVSV